MSIGLLSRSLFCLGLWMFDSQTPDLGNISEGEFSRQRLINLRLGSRKWSQ